MFISLLFSRLWTAFVLISHLGMTKVISEHLMFDYGLKIQEAVLKDRHQTYKRKRILREGSSAVLLVNTDTQCVVLTRQFRYAVHHLCARPFYEIPAGRMEHLDSPMQTIIREIQEETGYHVRRTQLKQIAKVFVSPGYTSEQLYLFYGEVRSSDKKSSGGGLAEEHENIDVLEIPVNDFCTEVLSPGGSDLKTMLAAQWLLLELNRKTRGGQTS
jgi:nudix-type nucleoside diphosphatase (YffH/AdpP family)